MITIYNLDFQLNMSSKYSFNCNYCYQIFENVTKEEFLIHLERCLSSKENFSNSKPIETTIDNNMNIASFTFGGKKEPNAITNVFQIHQNFQLEDRQERPSNNQNPSFVKFNDKIGSHNSFIISIIHTISNMKKIFEYIMYESNINQENKEPFLFNLKVNSLN